MVDEFPDVVFYVLNEPAMTSPEPDEIGVWQELQHLRTENVAWRECVHSILLDTDHYRVGDELKDAIRQRLVSLGERVAKIYRPAR